MTTDQQLRNRSHSKLGNHKILGKTAFNLSKYIYENLDGTLGSVIGWVIL